MFGLRKAYLMLVVVNDPWTGYSSDYLFKGSDPGLVMEEANTFADLIAACDHPDDVEKAIRDCFRYEPISYRKDSERAKLLARCGDMIRHVTIGLNDPVAFAA